ncbi:MAG: PilZ domain-containing protein [Proteobacteria bacterium]|nr:PilZ domain-containing protein [Pseudomonadota bacterium]
MVGVLHGAASEIRDKRYAGHALIVDLQDGECETKTWSAARFLVTAGPHSVLANLDNDAVVTGVFSFGGEVGHGLFEARIEELDRERGMLGGRFMWINEDGRRLLTRMARPGQPMKIALARTTANWSFSGLLLAGYRGELKDGARLRGTIWSDSPKDPGLFAGHVVHVNRDKHTLAIQFGDLPAETFSLLEGAMKKRDGAVRQASART